MPAPAATICAARRRPAAPNGATASRGCWRRRSTARPRTLLAPYLDAVRALNPGGELATYPGSPARHARRLLRSQDRLVACELEPSAAAALAHNLGGDRRAKAVAIDGWTALNAYVPPPERRGVVLIDPPFEATDEFSRLAQALEAAHRKWATGIFLLWYPLKGRQDSGRAGAASAALGDPKSAAGGSRFRSAARAGRSRRLRADRGQSALDCWPANSKSCCRFSPSCSPETAASTGSRAAASDRRLDAGHSGESTLLATFPQPQIRIFL